MKKYILVTLFAIGLINASILASSPINEENENKKTVYNIEKANATYAEGQIYFNITMDYELEKSMYSLVRVNADGSIESIGIKNGFVNLNQLPLRYSFKDGEAPTADTEYELYRIGSESALIAVWEFDAATKSIKSTPVDSSLSQNILR